MRIRILLFTKVKLICPPTGQQNLHATIVSAQDLQKMAPEFGLLTDPERDPAFNSKCESGSAFPKNWDPCGTESRLEPSTLKNTCFWLTNAARLPIFFLSIEYNQQTRAHAR
jgi:hypothetical protein